MNADNLTFNYGETPHEVIRERFADLQRRFNDGGDMPENAGWWTVVHYEDVADLLTVLDALADYGVRDGADGLDGKFYAGRQLRISILAALGVTEA